MTRRFIESSFPIKQVGLEATREKRIRKGHISTMFRWWARRPLASSRATNFAALISKPESVEKERELSKFIEKLSRWENSTDKRLLRKAKQYILESNHGKPPVILDPFSGGGSIPLEALRLGCEIHATDYNPVAVLLLKCTLEYPQKFRQDLITELQKWGKRVIERVRLELADLHDSEINREEFNDENRRESHPKKQVIGYLWSWTLRCMNPSCNLEIPLFKHYWLAKKNKRKVYLHPKVKDGKVSFSIHDVSSGDGLLDEKAFNPNEGTVSRANVTCLSCGSVIPARHVRREFLNARVTPKLIAVVERDSSTAKKKYRVITKEDIHLYQRAEQMLQNKIEQFQKKHGFYPLPNEKLPPKDTLGFRVQRYGMLEWQDLFNARQKLFFIILMDVLLELKARFLSVNAVGTSFELNEAVITYLSMLMVDLARYNCILNRWVPESESLAEVFGRQAFSMIWNHFENEPLGLHGGTWERRLKTLLSVIEHLSTIESPATSIRRASAIQLPFEDESFDAVFTDPPYYDNVPYSYLSDFFYVWLKRLLGDVHEDLFYSRVVPKKGDLVAYTHKSSSKEAKTLFEKELGKAFNEIYRVLRPNGIGIILYAHKTTSGWEAVINALLQSGLVITAAWPIATEQRGRLRARESAALSTTTYIVVRKIQKKKLGIYPEVKRTLERLLMEKLLSSWNEGIRGADFFIAAIGCGLEAYGMFERVIDHFGHQITASQILEDIRRIAIKVTMTRLFSSESLTRLTPLTQFYVTWRWCFQDRAVPFDDARKLAQSLGIDLEDHWRQIDFLQKNKDLVRVLGPQERDVNAILMKDTEFSKAELIDILHLLVLTWKQGNSELFSTLLDRLESNIEIILILAQAIAETLSMGNKEHKLLEHFITFMQKSHR